MIIPTPEFDPFFARDGIPFRKKMLGYIEREFSDLINEKSMRSTFDDSVTSTESAVTDHHLTSEAERKVA